MEAEDNKDGDEERGRDEKRWVSNQGARLEGRAWESWLMMMSSSSKNVGRGKVPPYFVRRIRGFRTPVDSRI